MNSFTQGFWYYDTETKEIRTFSGVVVAKAYSHADGSLMGEAPRLLYWLQQMVDLAKENRLNIPFEKNVEAVINDAISVKLKSLKEDI